MDNPIAMFGHTEYKANHHIMSKDDILDYINQPIKEREFIWEEILAKMDEEDYQVVEIPKIKHLANPENIL